MAEPYVTDAEVDAYWAAYGGAPSAWSSASESAKLAARVAASRWLDLSFGSRWKGYRSTDSQERDHPRSEMLDRDGYPISSSTVHQSVKDATCEAVVLQLAGTLAAALPDSHSEVRIKRERKASPGGSKEVEYVGSGARSGAASTRFPKIELLLRDVLEDASGSMRLRTEWSG